MNKLLFAFKKLMTKKSGRLSQNWDFSAEAVLLASPIVADIDGDGKQEIIFGTKDGKIYVLDSSAAVRWVYDAKENYSDMELMFLDTESVNSINSPPNVADINGDGKKELVFGSESGNVYALSDTGKLLWKLKAPAPIRGAVCLHNIVGDRLPEIIFGCSDKNLYVINSQGKFVWRFQAGAEIESSPYAFAGKKKHIIFGDNEGTIYSVDFRGQLEWSYKTGGKITAQAAVGSLLGDGELMIVIGSSDNAMYAFDESGNLKWKYQTEGAILSKATLADLNGDKLLEVVFGSCDNCVYALTATGQKMWSYETDFWVVATPVVIDIDGDGKNEVIVGSYDHNLYVLDSQGSYVFDYVPGVSGVAQQSGHYSDVMTQEPGKLTGKKLWQYQTEGIIVGCASLDDSKHIILNTEIGKVKDISHKQA